MLESVFNKAAGPILWGWRYSYFKDALALLSLVLVLLFQSYFSRMY